ncbi:hypothetical protein TREES_T100012243 [Tupaia chinensis]|uniref:Uncharacterized protein n=1 Tax=Tupaia chinensis TaxID=246437 RepID=L9JFJ5_TUPCH|nr:hypothetical protein TREES_T100012243 [Tupaia chinensis]
MTSRLTDGLRTTNLLHGLSSETRPRSSQLHAGHGTDPSVADDPTLKELADCPRLFPTHTPRRDVTQAHGSPEHLHTTNPGLRFSILASFEAQYEQPTSISSGTIPQESQFQLIHNELSTSSCPKPICVPPVNTRTRNRGRPMELLVPGPSWRKNTVAPCQGPQESKCKVAQISTPGPSRSWTWIPRVSGPAGDLSHTTVVLIPQRLQRTRRLPAAGSVGSAACARPGSFREPVRLRPLPVPGALSLTVHPGRVAPLEQSRNLRHMSSLRLVTGALPALTAMELLVPGPSWRKNTVAPCQGPQESKCKVAQISTPGPSRSWTWIPRVSGPAGDLSHTTVVLIPQRLQRTRRLPAAGSVGSAAAAGPGSCVEPVRHAVAAAGTAHPRRSSGA